MEGDIIGLRIAAIHRSLETMADNLAFVRGEAPSLPVPNQTRSAIIAMCDQFASALYDVRKGVWDLAEALGAGGDDGASGGSTGGDPRATIARIRTWLRQEVETMHGLVMSLRDDPALSIAHVLVAEAAVNILAAYSTTKEELEAIMIALDGADS